MTHIHLTTAIQAPVKEVFNRSLDIDFHQESASQTQEKAIDGVTSGIIGLGETVTWRGKHFGFWLTHTSIISELIAPSYFVDKMVTGNFKSFRHEHRFQERSQNLSSTLAISTPATVMTDHLSYKVPYGILGHIFDTLCLKKYLNNFLKMRNSQIKKTLETK